jgi:hypothetical protein
MRPWRALKNKTFKRVFFRKTFMSNFFRLKERYIRLFTTYIRLIPRYIRLFHKLDTNPAFQKKFMRLFTVSLRGIWFQFAPFSGIYASKKLTIAPFSQFRHNYPAPAPFNTPTRRGTVPRRVNAVK